MPEARTMSPTAAGAHAKKAMRRRMRDLRVGNRVARPGEAGAVVSDVHVHDCECPPVNRCSYCGCCWHCTSSCLCRVLDAPEGMACPDTGCGCVGRL